MMLNNRRDCVWGMRELFILSSQKFYKSKTVLKFLNVMLKMAFKKN